MVKPDVIASYRCLPSNYLEMSLSIHHPLISNTKYWIY